MDDAMRPALRSNVYFGPVQNGVYFNGGSERSFVLQGAGIYPVVSKLIAAMSGDKTKSSLLAALPAKVQPIFERLFSELSSRNLIIDMREGIPLSALERELYGDVIAHLSELTTDFNAAFARWRQSRIIAVGQGYVLKALVRSLARMGVGNLIVVEQAVDGQRPAPDEVIEVLNAHAARDPEFSFAHHLNGALPPELWHHDWRVIFGSDELPYDTPGTLLHEIVSRRRTGLLVGGVFRGHGVIGPDAYEDTAGFEDLADRLADLGASARHTIMSKSVIGNLLAIETLKAVAGTIGRRPQMSSLANWILEVSPGPRVTRRPVFPKPLARVTDISNLRMEVSADEQGSPYQRVEKAMAALFDPLTGLFAKGDDGALRQLPMSHSAIEVRLPRSAGGERLQILGWGLGLEAAGGRALLSAVHAYCEKVEEGSGVSTAHPLHVDIDEHRWLAAAVAGAVFRSPLQHQAVTLDAGEESKAYPIVRALLRIARLYGDSLPILELKHVPGIPAYWCRASINDLAVTATAPSSGHALGEALGSLCSRLQFPQQSVVHSQVSSCAEVWAENTEPEESVEQALANLGYEVSRQPFSSDPAMAQTGLVIGRAVLTQLSRS